MTIFSIYYEDKKRIKEVDEGATESFRDQELDLWAALWSKPQAAAWDALGLKFQVAAYVRAYLESTAAESTSGLKTAVLRMETELGISVAGMRQNLWRIGDGTTVTAAPKAPSKKPKGANVTALDSWTKGISVEGT